MNKTTKPRLLVCVVAMALSAFIAGCSSSEGSSSSIAGTRWDGYDDFGEIYQMYFDPGGVVRAYAVDYDIWIDEETGYELSWSQNGDVVTLRSTDLLENLTIELTGTIDGDSLYLEGSDSEYGYSFDLTKAE